MPPQDRQSVDLSYSRSSIHNTVFHHRVLRSRVQHILPISPPQRDWIGNHAERNSGLFILASKAENTQRSTSNAQRSMKKRESAFMQWAKTRPKVKYDLALSGILNLPFAELDAKLSDIDLNGDNLYGFGPLVDALAAHADVPRDCIVTISGGTSMANHLAMAAAIEPGDEVLIEQPTYEPLLALAQYFGVNVKRFARPSENNFRVDLDDLTSQVTSRTRLIVLTNLHNPSSALIDEETLRRIG